MGIQFSVVTHHPSNQRRTLNAIMAILTGVLVLLWPEALYYILGSYLVATGLIYFFFRAPSFLTGTTILAGVLIFFFPFLIPFLFAFFLLMLGIGAFLSGGLTGFSVFPILAALMLIFFPDIISYIVAFFLLIYGITSIVSMFQAARKKDDIIEVY
ncbi:DUF3096 domain-containing protein [Balneolaceae bacterium ANBcel3]|nr:DUF3096 domain-containing protein [Balneolaceae bacterium ANBcel3]